MTEPTSYARSFIRSAWLLLGFQLFAALVAIGVTGWAALYVADLRAERDALRMELASLTGESLPDADQAAIEELIAEDPDIEEPATERPTTRPALPTAEDPAPAPAPETRRPAAQSTSTSAPSNPATVEETPTRRRNTVYPGGLPGQNPASDAPLRVPPRSRTPSTEVGPTTPNLGDMVDRLPNQPTRDPQRQPTRDPQCVPTPNQPCR